MDGVTFWNRIVYYVHSVGSEKRMCGVGALGSIVCFTCIANFFELEIVLILVNPELQAVSWFYFFIHQVRIWSLDYLCIPPFASQLPIYISHPLRSPSSTQFLSLSPLPSQGANHQHNLLQTCATVTQRLQHGSLHYPRDKSNQQGTLFGVWKERVFAFCSELFFSRS